MAPSAASNVITACAACVSVLWGGSCDCGQTAKSCNVASTCTVAKSCSVAATCNIPKTCDVAKSCQKVKSCETKVTVPDFNYGSFKAWSRSRLATAAWRARSRVNTAQRAVAARRLRVVGSSFRAVSPKPASRCRVWARSARRSEGRGSSNEGVDLTGPRFRLFVGFAMHEQLGHTAAATGIGVDGARGLDRVRVEVSIKRAGFRRIGVREQGSSLRPWSSAQRSPPDAHARPK